MNKQYGKTFKEMRKSAQVPLTYFSKVGIPASTLSDFERGHSMITLEKLDNALQLMEYSLADYDNFLNHYTTTDYDYLLDQSEKYTVNNDVTKIEQLIEICKRTNQERIAIALNIMIGNYSAEGKEELVSYLYSLRYFSTRDLWILYILISHIHPKDTINILYNLLDRGTGLSKSEKHKRVLALALSEAVLFLSYFNYKDESKKIMNIIIENDIFSGMFFHNYWGAVEGYWEYHFQDQKLGRQKIDRFFKIQHLAGIPEVTKFYEKKFKNLIDLTSES
ncbi:hypothetical protein [Lactococcus garvieae]|uniref:Rgg/GadR/MutR family transcriptional regulator n=1 Tax=Lactococcus garvieae TaxID=1363 RepID=UPI00398EBAD7